MKKDLKDIPFIPYKDRLVILPMDVRQKGKIIMPNEERGFAGLDQYEDHPYMGEIIAVAPPLKDEFKVGEIIMLDTFNINRVENINVNGSIFVVIKTHQVIGKRPDLEIKPKAKK